MKKAWGILLVAALPMAAACDDLGTGGNDDNGAVYTMTNVAGANRVVVFSRDANGTLTRVDSIATGGQGSGPDPVFGTDPLTSQDAVILSDDNRFLFVVNAGSNDVSSFRVGANGALTLAGRASSGGVFPVSLAAKADLLYVVNGKGGGSISALRIASDGSLAPIAGSTRPLSGAADPGPGSIRISPSRSLVVITEKPTNRLDIYALDANGVATTSTPTVINSPAPTPFGADFDPAGRYILSEGNIGPNRAAVPDGSFAGSLAFTSTTAPSIVTGGEPTTETAACWVQITPDGRYAYTTNTGSGSITGFSIGAGGALTRLTPDGKTGVIGAGTQPLDMAYAGGYLYAVTPGDNGIHGFRVSSDGSLSAVAGATVTGTLPISVTGLAAF